MEMQEISYYEYLKELGKSNTYYSYKEVAKYFNELKNICSGIITADDLMQFIDYHRGKFQGEILVNNKPYVTYIKDILKGSYAEKISIIELGQYKCFANIKIEILQCFTNVSGEIKYQNILHMDLLVKDKKRFFMSKYLARNIQEKDITNDNINFLINKHRNACILESDSLKTSFENLKYSCVYPGSKSSSSTSTYNYTPVMFRYSR